MGFTHRQFECTDHVSVPQLWSFAFCTVQRSDVNVHVLRNTIEKQLVFGARPQLCRRLSRKSTTNMHRGLAC